MKNKVKNVYIVTRGEYSDYGMEAVFSTKKLAEKYLTALGIIRYQSDKGEISYSRGNYDTYYIEEWPINANLNNLKSGKIPFLVSMNREGKALQVSKNVIGNDAFLLNYNKILKTVWAKDEKHAVKIVNEKRVQMIANGDWN